MKTVLHMIETGGTGGAETVYVNLVRGLDPSRWRHVPVLPIRDWMYEQLAEAGVEAVLMADRSTFDFAYYTRMAALIRRERVDLIHAHLFGSAVRAGLLARLCGVPAIATLHGGMDLPQGERFRAQKLAIVNRGLKRIVFVSERFRRSFLVSVPIRPELTTVIPNGIDVARFSTGGGDGFRAEFGIRPDEFVVGTVASPGRAAKGLDVFLEVAALLKQRSQGIRFFLVGALDHGRGVEMLSQRAALGLTNDVIVTGFRSDVERAHAAFDVYALTSRSEGFSISLIEAMASKRAVVATRCGGPEEILDDGVTGLLVENGSAEAIAGAIQRLRGSAEERERLGAAAREQVRARFRIETQIESYERLYEESISGNATSDASGRTAAGKQSAP
jgi:glycosyltransferase involved in cell wall biosynthesis